jgi:hypothetical protein
MANRNNYYDLDPTYATFGQPLMRDHKANEQRMASTRRRPSTTSPSR